MGYLDSSSDEMSQTFSVLSPLPLTPPALRPLWSRLRSLPAGLRYGSAHQDLPPPPAAYLMELRSTRKPRSLFRPSGVPLLRYADRQYLAR